MRNSFFFSFLKSRNIDLTAVNISDKIKLIVLSNLFLKVFCFAKYINDSLVWLCMCVCAQALAHCPTIIITDFDCELDDKTLCSQRRINTITKHR